MKQKLLSILALLVLCVTGAWGASGDVLFSQNFNSATPVAYTNGTETAITSSGSNNIVGSTAGAQFSYIGITSKSSAGFAINSKTGGNSVDASGIFQAYCNATGQNWAIVHNTGFAATAPTALKVSMKIYFVNLSSASDYAVSFAIGNSFANGTSAPAAANVHSGFSLINNSNETISQYLSKTNIYNTDIGGAWKEVTWVINNTGEALSYSDPKSTTTSVNNDCFDLWIGTTLAVHNQAATTATANLQNLYIGDPAGKKNEFRLDDIVVTDLTPSSGPAAPTFSKDAGASLLKNSGTVDLTSEGNTVYYKWSTTADAYSDGATLAGEADGNASSPATAIAPNAEGTYYLYAVAYDGTSEYSDVVSRSYEIQAQTVTGITINGIAISSEDLSTLNSTHAVTIDGSELNGLGNITLTINGGDAPTVTRSVASGVATYTYTLNEVDYTLTLNYGVRDFGEAQGSVVYAEKNGTKPGEYNGNNSPIVANAITFSYVEETPRAFQNGAGTVTLGSDTYKSIKLSTGKGVTVTFPEGKKATKIIVYGWSADGTGWLKTLSETDGGSNYVYNNVALADGDQLYATNNAQSYPTVSEYDLSSHGGYWTSAYFHGAGSQPFVVMDFVFASAPIITTQPVSASYTKNDVATALSVEATSSDANEVSYQWYSCTNDEGANASTISGETSATFTPSTATGGVFYYFCRITDSNGSSDSDVATITVTAPTTQTIFSYTVTADNVTNNTTDGVYDETASGSIGGTCSFNVTTDDKSTKKGYFTTSSSTPEYYFNGDAAYVKLTLSEGNFQKDDVISIYGSANTANYGFYINTENTKAGLLTTTYSSKNALGTVTAPIDDDRAGLNTLYIKRNSGGMQLASVTVTRTSTKSITTNSGGWTSFTPEWNCTLSDGATAYIITDVDNSTGSVDATAVTTLKVGEGYFINGEASTPYTATATTADADVTTNNLLVGCATATAINATTPVTDDKYVLGTATQGTYAGKSGLFKVTSNVNVGAGKAYLQTNGSNGATFLSIIWDDDMTTNINLNLNVNDNLDKTLPMYNLAGQKVSESYKGIVIQNGKKVVRK